MKTPKFLDESVCIGCKQVLGVALSCVWFGLVLRNFWYKGNGEVSNELLSNCFKNSVLVLAID